MKRVRITCSMTGDRFSHVPGDEVDVDDATAARMEAGQLATILGDAPEPKPARGKKAKPQPAAPVPADPEAAPEGDEPLPE